MLTFDIALDEAGEIVRPSLRRTRQRIWRALLKMHLLGGCGGAALFAHL